MALPKDVPLPELVGILASTAFGVANLTLSHIAVPCLLSAPPAGGLQKSNNDNDDSIQQRLAYQWQQVYFRGHKVGPASALVGVAGFVMAAIRVPQQEPRTQTWLYIAAACAASVIPFTLTAMKSTNDELHRRADAIVAKSYVQPAKGPLTSDLVQQWANLNTIRAFLPIIAAAFGFATFYL